MSAFNVVLGCVMALLLILFTISSMARYYIKFTLFTIFCLLFATAPMPLMLLRPFSPKNALIPSALLRLSARMLGIRWKVRGLENIENSRGCVILLNHQSALDLYAHAGLRGNERADQLAKEAALRMKTKPNNEKCPISFDKKAIRSTSICEWNKRYQEGTVAGTTKVFFPDAALAHKIDISLKILTTQMLTGHGGFCAYFYKFKKKESPSCICSPDMQETHSTYYLTVTALTI